MPITVLTPKDKHFPTPLKAIHSCPKQLFVLSEKDLDLEGVPTVAIVGSRRPTAYGIAITKKLAYDLAKHGVVIVSGLALGLDSVAHQAALDAGGKTIAVLPSSVNEIYPRTHFQLAQDIIKKGGALVSEYPDGTDVRSENFIARNRIIAGLAKATIITEAALKSGSLHTAGFALDEGRTVMAIPGPINSPLSEGANNLIKHGAGVVTSANDVLNELGIETRQAKDIVVDNKNQQTIIDLIANGITEGRELAKASNIPASEFNQALTLLELNGTISSSAGNWQIS